MVHGKWKAPATGAVDYIIQYTKFRVADEFRLVMALLLDESCGSELSITDDESPILTYHHGCELHKPYFHPIHAPDESIVTDDAPGDRPYHHGLWFAWENVDGVNYCRETDCDESERGRIVHREFHDKGVNQHAAHFAVVNDWVAPDNSKPIEELCRIWVHRPQHDRQLIDLQFNLLAQSRDVLIGVSHESQGLCFRGAEMEYRKVTNSEYAIGQSEVSGKAGKWCSLNGVLSDEAIGVAIFDHPSNVGHPARFFALDDAIGFVSTSFAYPHTIAAGETLTLSYRIVVYLGDLFTFDLGTCYDEYAKQG